MFKVYKYPFAVTDHVVIRMPVGAKILHVAGQGDTPCVWAIVDTAREPVAWHFRLFGTGHNVAKDMAEMAHLNHVATFQMPPFVWHAFLVGGAPEWERYREEIRRP